MTQAEQHKQIARRWFNEVFAAGKLDVADEIFSADFFTHDPGLTGDGWPTGPEGPKTIAGLWKSVFPDLRFTIEDEIAEGDTVALRWTATGTHQGTLLDIPASGRTVRTSGIDIFRMEDGKAVEHWVIYDLLGILTQVGAIPAPEAAVV
jgi:steroid delta-isomerase-like uncharacterized protein